MSLVKSRYAMGLRGEPRVGDHFICIPNQFLGLGLGKGVFSCQAVSGPDDGKVELLSKVAERFDITEQRRH